MFSSVLIIGWVAKKPEIGDKYVRLVVGVWRNMREHDFRPCWIPVVLYGSKQAEHVRKIGLKQGDLVLVEGILQSNIVKKEEETENIEKYVFIRGRTLRIIQSKNSES
ncbi:MAG: single-stranded DNA-binding protein [Thermoproteota archaeon]